MLYSSALQAVCSGVLYQPGCAFGGEYLVPISCGGIVDGYVAWLFAPLYDEAETLGFFEPLAFTLQEADEGVLAPGYGFVELFCGYVLGSGDSQGEAVCLERHASGAQFLEEGAGVHTSNLTMPSSSGAYKACRRAL